MYIFEISTLRKDEFFDAPFGLFKEKKFLPVPHSLVPYKIFCHTSKLLNVVKITGPYCRPSSRETEALCS
jgi:hypothetical protein